MTFRICISIEKNNLHYLYIFRNNEAFMQHFIPNIQKLKTAKTQELYLYEIYQNGLEYLMTKWLNDTSCAMPTFSLPMPSIYETTEGTVYRWDNPEINEFLLEDYKKRGGAKSPPETLPFEFKKKIAEELSSKSLFVITIPNLSWLNHKQIKEKMTFQLPLDKTGNVIKKNIINKLNPIHFMLNYDSIIKGCVNPKHVVSKRESLLKKKEILEMQIRNIDKELDEVDANTPGRIDPALLKPSKSGLNGKRQRTQVIQITGIDEDEDEDEDEDDDVVESTPPRNKKNKQST